MSRPDNTTLALLGAFGVLLLIIAFFAVRSSGNPDRLDDLPSVAATVSSAAKTCAGNRINEALKQALFTRAAQTRGSDGEAYAQISAAASVRMENPALENEQDGTAFCTGSLSIALPPGIAASGGRRNLMGDVDYAVGGDGGVAIRNADSLINPLATLSRTSQGITAPLTGEADSEDVDANVDSSESAKLEPGPRSDYPGRPSFDCDDATTKGEIAVCNDPGLSALDVNMAAQYRRGMEAATPAQRHLLQSTTGRFLAYRDHCRDAACIGDAYVGRMREIRDIMEGRWQPPR
jgi:hypothetical protein